MHGTKQVFVLGAALACLLPWSALARDPIGATRAAGSVPHLVTVQYDGPSPYGPEGAGGPDGGPGGDYDGGPGPGYGGGPGGGMGYGGPGYGRQAYGGPDEEGAPSRGTGKLVSYHGFRIDLQGTGAGELSEVEHQIDIVDRAGLSSADLRLFRSQPIKVDPFGGRTHSNRGTSVVLGGLPPNDSRPVLLHEYMHILHRAALPGGFDNPTIERFYEEAESKNLYPAGSYMMSNRREFFAVTASCYLHGSVEREPFTRDAIRQQQPDYYAYLGHLFGH